MTASTFRDLAAEAVRRLEAAGVEGARREAWLLLEVASGRSRAQLLAHGDERPDQGILDGLERILARRLAREPLAYVRGEKEFWSLGFEIGPGVLVPRPETETVVEAVLDHLPDRRRPYRILDLGTGSGCLLLALLSELPGAVGVGVDLAPAAVACAHANAVRLGFAGRSVIARGSWGMALAGPFDLIVSNPPYICRGAWPDLAPEIREHEPEGALLAGPDGLEAYRALAADVARLLRDGGLVCVEHGHDQADAVATLMRRAGLREIERRRDLAGHARALVIGK